MVYNYNGLQNDNITYNTFAAYNLPILYNIVYDLLWII